MKKLSSFALLIALVLFANTATADTAAYKGHAVNFMVKGEGETTIVLVHGWGGNASFWNGQTDALARRNRGIVLDLPGHGKSAAPRVDYTQQYFARAIIAVMDAAHADKAVLVGHSMAGSTIRWAAKLYPERAEGLVIVDGAIHPMPRNKAKRQEWLREMRAFVAKIRKPGSEEGTNELLDMLHTEQTPQEVRDAVRKSVLATPRHVRDSAMDNLFKIKTMDIGPIETPTLALYVRNEHLPPNFAAQMRLIFPGMTYEEFEGPGHYLMMERPGEVNERIEAFVKQLSNPPCSNR